ncbi:MAG: CRISPR-associated RAMP protein Csx7 [Candidatus Caldarchaeum sp.]
MTGKTYWTSSKILLRETVFEGQLVNLTPLRIGAGREPPLGALVDLAVLRIKIGDKNLPYIPGSSLKGVFRSHAEAIARVKDPKTCTGLSKGTCIETKTYFDPSSGETNLAKYIEEKLKHNEPEKAMEAFFKTACLMCKIFGAPSYASKAVFSDAYPDGETKLGIRTGVAISRKTGAVAFGPYQVEYVEPGSRFSFALTLRNIPNYALGLIAHVLNMVESGEVRIGGFKTRGFGKVTIENIRFRNREVGGTSSVLRSLEEGVDQEVDISSLVVQKNGWAVSEGSKCLQLMDRLMEVWDNAKLTSHQE